MSGPTPGPWKVVMELNGKPSVWTDESPDDRIRLARINCDTRKVDEEAFAGAMADARLMAAAPDLLAACEAMVAQQDAGMDLALECDRELEAMRAAIAKARGGGK